MLREAAGVRLDIAESQGALAELALDEGDVAEAQTRAGSALEAFVDADAPADSAAVALALCTPDRAHVNGAAIEIDGSEW